MALIIVDKREDALARGNKDSPISFLESVIDKNNRLHSDKLACNGGGKLDYILRQVSIGDYLIILRDPSGKASRLAAIIERKTWKDLGASIPNSHVDNQIKKMKELQTQTGCLLYFIIEGALTYEDDTKVGGKHGLKFSQLHAKARHTMHRGIPFVQTKDPMHTIVMLTKFARDFIMLSTRGELEFKTMAEFKSSNNAAGASEASEVSETGNASETVEDLLNFENYLNKTAKSVSTDIVIDIWTAIPGVTFNSAPVLKEKYNIGDLFIADAIRLDVIKAEIAELVYPSGMKIGKQSEKIVSNFFNENYKATAVKCLCAIKGVGEKAAQSIADAIDFKDLCANKIPVDEIAEIYIGKNRLGMTKAERINNLFNKN